MSVYKIKIILVKYSFCLQETIIENLPSLKGEKTKTKNSLYIKDLPPPQKIAHQ